MNFKDTIRQGIPKILPPPADYDIRANHAPKRKDILDEEEKRLAVRNALRYFPPSWHKELATEFYNELKAYGRIYMYRFQPTYDMYARPIDEYPAKCKEAAGIMLMIQNNLDPNVAQHPSELITYGGNGSVFQNWAQYLITMRYLSEMNDAQTLHMYSGHPMGLFPSNSSAPRVVVTNGMMIPNYSQPQDWEKYNALGVTQYGQMTAGSYMYIGPQGIVHGTTLTVLNAFRKLGIKDPRGKIFLTSGLGGMSGAQPKAGNIAGCVTICAEVNPLAAQKRHDQGWVDECYRHMHELIRRVKKAVKEKESVSLAYIGNVIEVWEAFFDHGIYVHIGSDQTSLHNPWSGGYYPVGFTYEEGKKLLETNPIQFRNEVEKSLRRQVRAINQHTSKGTYFFDYGNAFLLEASRAEAEIMDETGKDFRYPSYVQDMMGPMCFDYGFGPFRWVCCSGRSDDLRITDMLALKELESMYDKAPEEINQQLADNIKWISQAESNNLVVGSQARILYADAEGRMRIASAFNDAIKEGKISAPVILGRDHHDVSGTDSPFRETSNIYDGSQFTADMAIHNVIGDGFRGATWISIHNGGGVGWGEVINGGFGLMLDGSVRAQDNLENMLFFDVNNGISRRAWARNPGAINAIKRQLKTRPDLQVTIANIVDDDIMKSL